MLDEVSMVGSNIRLQQIKGVSDDAVFSGVSILAVGTCISYHQLVKHLCLALSVSDSYTVTRKVRE